MNIIIALLTLACGILGLQLEFTNLALDYFTAKDVKYLCYFTCKKNTKTILAMKTFLNKNIRVSVKNIDAGVPDLERFLHQSNVAIGVMLDSTCNNWGLVLEEASRMSMFDAMHMWLVLMDDTSSTIDDTFQRLDLSVDADVVAVQHFGASYQLTDVFNFGRIQGNGLEKYHLGTWTADKGLYLADSSFKYYRRWDFHNLTLRAVTVFKGDPKVFRPELLLDLEYNAALSHITKVPAQLLHTIKLQHNFRFNYTVVPRWIGEPAKNSTLTVTNSLLWREQDISCTSARIFSKWLDWVDVCHPSSTMIETKFYYLIPDKGVGEYENQFLAPMSAGVWWCSCACAVACVVVLAAAAGIEGRPKSGVFALFSVLAAVAQQSYDDGVQLIEERFSSQGRRAVLLVIGLTSMLLYNYYTSSVVSWLLNAAAPNIASIDGLIASDLELVLEDVGYARGWIDNPGFFYFSGIKNVKEDELRDKKVTHAKRTTDIFASPSKGIELVRQTGYAYHTDPYTASQVISRTFEDQELCKLGSLQMMPDSHVYIMAQKRSPYGQFFTWSLMRLAERGHLRATQAKVAGSIPACSGQIPRALALGQAAPAFLLLAQLTVVAVLILTVEILCHRYSYEGKIYQKMNIIIALLTLACGILGLQLEFTNLALDYFTAKDVKYLCYFTCKKNTKNILAMKTFLNKNIRVSVKNIEAGVPDLERFLHQSNVAIGVMLDSTCNNWGLVLEEASRMSMFDAMHMWLVLMDDTSSTIDDTFQRLDLSVDADVVAVQHFGASYQLTDVFNFGRIQGNGLEKYHLGTWTAEKGLCLVDTSFKYYRRWDFHNLTLRAVTVFKGDPEVFRPELLLDLEYNAALSHITKVPAQLLHTIKLQHNFRFNYTVVPRWIGEPAKNSTLTVTNSLLWREQDISCTSARIFSMWLDWVDIFHPSAIKIETKFYYLIPDKGVGEYENQFLAPMSAGVWWCSCACAVACVVVLAAAAGIEGRPKSGVFALFSVLAAVAQQSYDDGVQLIEERFSSQGRRAVLLVIGLTSMLLYNYYTSSVVSWLLNAAAPNIASIDGLIASDLELVLEDVGYARGWIDNPGFFYFSGIKNVKEDELRDKKVTHAKRTTDIFASPSKGIELVRQTGYAYHTDPYTASQVISRTFEDQELCKLGSLQMMPDSHVYIMAQKRSPYGQFFTWSLMRLAERGHLRATQAKVAGSIPACSGQIPRALALGQAAPAFLLLAQLTVVAVLILTVEILCHRIGRKKGLRNNRSHNAQLRTRNDLKHKK